jgi:hypothetical protein
MFVGHFAVGLALKRVAPRTSLGSLVAAPQVADMLWPIFLVLGWEHVRIDPGNTAFTPLAFDSYPISHSVLMLGSGVRLAGCAPRSPCDGVDRAGRRQPLGARRRNAPP